MGREIITKHRSCWEFIIVTGLHQMKAMEFARLINFSWRN